MPILEINKDGSLTNKEDLDLFKPFINTLERHTCENCDLRDILCPEQVIKICTNENIIFKKVQKENTKPNEYRNLE